MALWSMPYRLSLGPSIRLWIEGLDGIHEYTKVKMLANQVINTHFGVETESSRLVGVHIILAVGVAEFYFKMPNETFACLVCYFVISTDEIVGHLHRVREVRLYVFAIYQT